MNEKVIRALELWKVENKQDAYWIVLLKENCEPEPMPVRIIREKDELFLGELLEEPVQDLGYHKGDHVGFEIYEDAQDNAIFIASLEEKRKIKIEELRNGKLLKRVLTEFEKNPTEEGLFDVIEVIRNSDFWIPFSIQMDDQKKEHIRIDVISNGYEKMIPVFTSKDEMGPYGHSIYKIEKHLLEVIRIARKHDEKPNGIVVNPFTDGFTVRKDLFDILESMKSNVVVS